METSLQRFKHCSLLMDAFRDETAIIIQGLYPIHKKNKGGYVRASSPTHFRGWKPSAFAGECWHKAFVSSICPVLTEKMTGQTVGTLKHSGIIHKESIVKYDHWDGIWCPDHTQDGNHLVQIQIPPSRSIAHFLGYFCMKIWIDAAVRMAYHPIGCTSGFTTSGYRDDCRFGVG